MSRTVTIYSTPSCHYCMTAKAYLKSKEIPFTEINVAGDSEMVKKLREISGGSSVPVLQVGDEVLVGWDEDKFKDSFVRPD